MNWLLSNPPPPPPRKKLYLRHRFPPFVFAKIMTYNVSAWTKRWKRGVQVPRTAALSIRTQKREYEQSCSAVGIVGLRWVSSSRCEVGCRWLCETNLRKERLKKECVVLSLGAWGQPTVLRWSVRGGTPQQCFSRENSVFFSPGWGWFYSCFIMRYHTEKKQRVAEWPARSPGLKCRWISSPHY